jgi:hypothetical protein
MTEQSGDGDFAGEPSHTEDRINWARRRTHARQRTADSRQRRISYSLDTLPPARPAPGASAAPYAGPGDPPASAVRPLPTSGPARVPDGADPLPTLDSEC